MEKFDKQVPDVPPYDDEGLKAAKKNLEKGKMEQVERSRQIKKGLPPGVIFFLIGLGAVCIVMIKAC